MLGKRFQRTICPPTNERCVFLTMLESFKENPPIKSGWMIHQKHGSRNNCICPTLKLANFPSYLWWINQDVVGNFHRKKSKTQWGFLMIRWKPQQLMPSTYSAWKNEPEKALLFRFVTKIRPPKTAGCKLQRHVTKKEYLNEYSTYQHISTGFCPSTVTLKYQHVTMSCWNENSFQVSLIGAPKVQSIQISWQCGPTQALIEANSFFQQLNCLALCLWALPCHPHHRRVVSLLA